MLAELEDALVAKVKGAPLGLRLATVSGMPDIDGANLVSRFGSEAPAVYVTPGSFPVTDGEAVLRFGIACVARNSRGQEAARKGDGMIVGLYQIMEGVASLFERGNVGGINWRVTGGDFIADEAIYKAGLQVGVIRIESAGPVELPPALTETALALFQTFHADYDIDPHVSGVEHAKWAANPPDHTTSAPDVAETTTLQP